MSTSLIYRSAAGYELLMRALYGRHYAARMRAVAGQVHAGASVLERCCGPATLDERHLRGRAGAYVGIDVNAGFVERLRRHGVDARRVDLAAGADSLPQADVVIPQAGLYHFLPRPERILDRMLANDEAVDQFVVGTVYQAFLSALNYHRWHSPVSGTIVKAFVKQGTYYSEADAEGEDLAGPHNSQGYITHVATRALFLIQADDPGIGMMCFMPVGMGEVSSCVIAPHIVRGYHVTNGQELASCETRRMAGHHTR